MFNTGDAVLTRGAGNEACGEAPVEAKTDQTSGTKESKPASDKTSQSTTEERPFCVHWDSERRWLGVQWDVFCRICRVRDMTSPHSKIDREGGWVYLDEPTDGRSFMQRYAFESGARLRRERIWIPESCDGPVSFIRTMPALAAER